MQHSLVLLPYSYNALEPYIDAKTMEVHYTKHHQKYLDNFQELVNKYSELTEKTAEEILTDIKNVSVDEGDRVKIRNNGGGFVNHNLYWLIMGPEKQTDEMLVKKIEETWGSLDNFKEEFNKLSLAHFGSGWSWLVRDENDKLKMYSLPNQDSPLSLGHTPIIGLDLWEHAYYLKYQNRRQDYIENWWKVLKLF